MFVEAELMGRRLKARLGRPPIVFARCLLSARSGSRRVPTPVAVEARALFQCHVLGEGPALSAPTIREVAPRPETCLPAVAQLACWYGGMSIVVACPAISVVI